MQDRYTGDLGDFGKYALLNALATGEPALSLGVHWYRVPDENHLNDGKFTGYLSRSPENDRTFRACDPVLHDRLAALVTTGRRRLEEVEGAGILPARTRYFSRPLTFAGLGAGRGARSAHRAAWHAEALEALAGCDLVFLDPDNGLECAVPGTAAAGPKYTLLPEAGAFSRRGQSLVIYHHIGRQGSAEEQVARQVQRLHDACPGAARPFALRWHRGTSRAYLIAPAPVHAKLLERRARALVESAWSQHWSGPLIP